MKVSTSAYARQTVSDRLRRLLFQSSALGLGVSIAVLKAGVAEAQLTGCNVETNTIDCPQGTYASISAASEGDMTITIAPGSTVEDLELVNENGATADLSLLAPGVDFTGVGTISGQSVILLNAATAGTSVPGDINVVVGTVSTGGDATSGIVAMGRNINITAESSATANANAFGIYGDTAAGAVTIHSGTVSTFGDLSTGILGRANIGTVDIVSGSVTAAGAGSYGILGTGGGDINITSEDVLGYGPVDMTTGQRTIGIAGVATSVPENRNGNVIIDSELARYHGHGSIGIYGATLDGDVTINSELITANASRDIDAACLIYLPAGIVAESETGDITVNSGVIRGDGRPGPGLQAPVSGAGIVVKQTTGLVTINSEEVFTSGRGSAGITTAGVFGDVVINSNRVSTGGLSAEVDTIEGAYPGRGRVYADAIEAISLGGSVTVNSERASAESGDSQAITIIAAKNATLNSATAETLGEGTNAIGISVENGIVDVTLTGNTRSIYGTGVSIVAANDSDVDVDIGAEASIAARDGGLVIVTGTGSTVVTNRGRIETAELVPGSVVGAAISVDGEVGSSITINNYGTIVGGVSASGAGGVAITFSDAVVNETLNLSRVAVLSVWSTAGAVSIRSISKGR